MTVATMTTAQFAAADAAERERQRIEAHQQAAADLAAVEIEWQAQVVPLEEAAMKAKDKLDRAQKALDQARESYNEAARQFDVASFRLSNLRDRAHHQLAQNADPAWDQFELELRTAGAAALKSRHDSVMGGGSFGHQTVDRERVAYNAAAKAFWQACQNTIEKVRERKRDPQANAEVEIPQLRDALPSIDTNNKTAA